MMASRSRRLLATLGLVASAVVCLPAAPPDWAWELADADGLIGASDVDAGSAALVEPIAVDAGPAEPPPAPPEEPDAGPAVVEPTPPSTPDAPPSTPEPPADADAGASADEPPDRPSSPGVRRPGKRPPRRGGPLIRRQW